MKMKLPVKPKQPDMYELMPRWADSYPVRGVEEVRMQIGGRKLRDYVDSHDVSLHDQLLFFKEVFGLSQADLRKKFGHVPEDDESFGSDEDLDEDSDDDLDDYGWYPDVTVVVFEEFSRRFNVPEDTIFLHLWYHTYDEPDMFLYGTRVHTEEEVKAAREPYEKAKEEYERAKDAYNKEIEALRLAYPFKPLPELIP